MYLVKYKVINNTKDTTLCRVYLDEVDIFWISENTKETKEQVIEKLHNSVYFHQDETEFKCEELMKPILSLLFKDDKDNILSILNDELLKYIF